MSPFDKDYFDRLERRRSGDPDYDPIRPPKPQPKEDGIGPLQTVVILFAFLGFMVVLVWIYSLSGLH